MNTGVDQILAGKFAQLAHPAGKYAVDFTKNVFLQPKLDGVRCIFRNDGAFSRRGNSFKNVEHLEMQLADFFEKFPNIILDGELYNHKLKNDFEKIISLVRKTTRITDQDRYEAASHVEFHVYDLFDINQPDLTLKRDLACYQIYYQLHRI